MISPIITIEAVDTKNPTNPISIQQTTKFKNDKIFFFGFSFFYRW